MTSGPARPYGAGGPAGQSGQWTVHRPNQLPPTALTGMETTEESTAGELTAITYWDPSFSRKREYSSAPSPLCTETQTVPFAPQVAR